MTHSINYYIQLSDKLAAKIDSADSEKLIQNATALLKCRKVLLNPEIYHDTHKRYAREVLNDFEVNTTTVITLAHGLLAKAV